MPTWDELRAHVKTKYKLAKDEPTVLGIQFGFKVDNREEVQRQRVELVTALGKPAVLIWGDVADASRVPAKLALQRNMRFELGAIAIDNDVYVLRAVLPLDGLGWDTLDAAMIYIAREAARLRETIPSS